MYDLTIDVAQVTSAEEAFIQTQVDQMERDGVIVGASGGIDSAVTIGLAVRALGPDRVHALLLPERESSAESITDARLQLERLGVSYEIITITPILSTLGIYRNVPIQLLGGDRIKAQAVRTTLALYRRRLGENPFVTGLLGTRGQPAQKVIDGGHAYARAKHRTRMITLYYHAERENRLVLGTANRTEWLTGAMVKWGDSAADAQPLLPLLKTQVRQLARFISVPQRIIDKPPTPDLMPGIDDETAYGMTYQTLDQILYGLEEGYSEKEIIAEAETDQETIRTVVRMLERSRHMRHLPAALNLSDLLHTPLEL